MGPLGKIFLSGSRGTECWLCRGGISPLVVVDSAFVWQPDLKQLLSPVGFEHWRVAKLTASASPDSGFSFCLSELSTRVLAVVGELGSLNCVFAGVERIRF